jgi:diacylglycerol kinase family enzyme
VIFEETSWYQLAQRMLHFFTSRFPHAPSKQSWHAQYSDLLSAEITTIPGIHHVQAQSVTIFTDNEPQAVTLDGEVCLQTPVEARVANEQLQILVPEETGWNTTSNQANARLLAKKQA